ncbi:MAG TPA: DUF389 domain-containing protein [Actinomycetota bacterium]|nr:DUF389 domain-containing protein [Actinomycetota bacterium]
MHALSLTVFVPADLAEAAIGALRSHEGVRNVIRVPGAVVETGDDLVAAAVVPSVADEVLVRLREVGVSTDRCTLSDRGIDLVEIGIDERGFGYWDRGSDAVVWDEVLEDAAEDSRLSLTYLVIMAIAGLIAAIGVYDDQPVLIVGAMALSPDLARLAALCIGLVLREYRVAARGATSLALGLGVAALAGAATIGLAPALGRKPAGGGFGQGLLTSFITDPGLTGAVVALVAGVAAVLSFERRSAGAVVGVAISVTTIPAAAGLGVAIGLGDLSHALGALAVLALNLACLTAAAVATLAIQRRSGG